MLQTLHDIFGFAGSMIVSFLVFMFFVFWMAGVAGLCDTYRDEARQNIFLAVGILVPVYPVAWLIVDMIKQKKKLRKL